MLILVDGLDTAPRQVGGVDAVLVLGDHPLGVGGALLAEAREGLLELAHLEHRLLEHADGRDELVEQQEVVVVRVDVLEDLEQWRRS